MGTWGGGLYQADEACDLRDSIEVLTELPWPGDKLLSLLLEGSYPQDTGDAAGSMFWLVTADQFERKGIVCRQAFDTAIRIITSKQDIANLRQLEMSERDLKKRENELNKLLIRLENPRLARKTPADLRQPAMIVKAGEIYTFPAMRGYMAPRGVAKGFDACCSRGDEEYLPPFSPDSWGAWVVLATGRAYRWLPWAACCPLLVPLGHKATLEEAVSAYLIPELEKTALIYRPDALHLKRMQAQCIGDVPLDAEKIAPLLPPSSMINKQMAIGWSLCSAAWNVVKPSGAYELRLADLLKTA